MKYFILIVKITILSVNDKLFKLGIASIFCNAILTTTLDDGGQAKKFVKMHHRLIFS